MLYLDPQAQLIHDHEQQRYAAIPERILEGIAASGPWTFDQTLEEVMMQCDVTEADAVPQTILAMADLIRAGKIQGYDTEDCPPDEAMAYAWEIAD